MEMMASVPLQETWTNSWTCWTSGENLLEEISSKDQSLDWVYTPTSTTTSNTSLRLDQNSSGQFDDDFPAMTMDYGSLANMKELDKDISFEDINLSQMLDMDMPADANMSEDDFLNNFMDLSEFLLPTEQPDEETEEVKNVIKLDDDLDVHPALVDSVAQEVVICEVPTPSVVSLKREIDDVDMTVDDSDWSLNMDHDYVTKKPRLSHAPVVESTKKPSKSTQSASKSASHKLSPDQKYRDRRVKNNIASRRSREIRKMKFGDMEEEANRLVVVNSELRTRIEEMEKLAKDMKALLVQKLAAK